MTNDIGIVLPPHQQFGYAGIDGQHRPPLTSTVCLTRASVRRTLAMPLLTRISLACCLGFGVVAGALAGSQDSRERDEQTLKEAGVAGEGKGLLDFFRKRTLTPEDRRELRAWFASWGIAGSRSGPKPPPTLLPKEWWPCRFCGRH